MVYQFQYVKKEGEKKEINKEEITKDLRNFPDLKNMSLQTEKDPLDTKYVIIELQNSQHKEKKSQGLL